MLGCDSRSCTQAGGKDVSRAPITVPTKNPHLYFLDTISMEWVNPEVTGVPIGQRYVVGAMAVALLWFRGTRCRLCRGGVNVCVVRRVVVLRC